MGSRLSDDRRWPEAEMGKCEVIFWASPKSINCICRVDRFFKQPARERLRLRLAARGYYIS